MMRAAAKQQSWRDDDDDDERNLLHHEENIKNNSSVVISTSASTNKTRKKPLLFSKSSPVDVRQIDSSFSFQSLEQDNEDEDEGELFIDDHEIEQNLLAIASFEASGCNHDEFMDEDETSEYSGAAQFMSSDTLKPYAQFVPGFSLDKSQHATTISIAVVDQPETVLHENEKDVEAQVPTQLAQSDNVIGAQIRQELLEGREIPPSRSRQQSNQDKTTPFKRNRCLLVASLILFLIGISLIIGFTMKSRRQRTNDSSVTHNTASCSFCADATIPPNLGTIRITDTQTCMDLRNSQAFLDQNDSQCQKGQALAWMFCNCPTLPTIPLQEEPMSSCTYCPDGVAPIGKSCLDYSNSVSLAAGSFCEQAIAAVPEHCICPNLDRMEQFRRLLWPLSGKALEDSTLPQFQALEWIANTDAHDDLDSTRVIQERYVAALLYFAFRGDAWLDRNNFLSRDDICKWNNDIAGIQCNESNQVTSIRLSNNRLQGAIPSEIRVFSSLSVLHLNSNDIRGSLPSSLFNLTILRQVDLSHNAIVGELPVSIDNATSLESLILRDNGLNGTLPSFIGQSTALQSLDLDSNKFSGSIPEFVSFSPVQQLLLGNNSFDGRIPDSVGALPQLEILSLVNNDLDGMLPDFSRNEESLLVLELSRNRLIGSLERLFSMTPSQRLTHVFLDDNLLTGTIPSSIGSFTRLVELRLGQNMLSGSVCSEIGRLTSIKTVLSLSNNRLSSTIPTELGQLVLLKELELGNNRLDGTIPLELMNIQGLEHLGLQKNNLNGDIGILLSILPRTLQTLNMDSNMLSGTLPTFVGDFGELQEFQFFANRLNGTIPSEIGRLTNIESIQLTKNSNLSGNIPSTIGDCSLLKYLSLGDCELEGTVPTEIAKLRALQRLFLVGNELSGSLDFLCTPDRQFDMLVANTCDAVANISMSCDCCTHCCDATATGCVGL